jgi:hypothetical protein
MTWLTVMEYMCHTWPRICSTWKHSPVLSSFTIYYWVCNRINTTCTTGRAGTAYPSGAPEFTLGFSGVSVTWSSVLIVIFWRSLFVFLSFSFGHCVVCSSSICRFWLSLWYLQTLLNKITWPEHCTITNFIGQYLQTFRIRTQRYFNSTKINFHRKRSYLYKHEIFVDYL